VRAGRDEPQDALGERDGEQLGEGGARDGAEDEMAAGLRALAGVIPEPVERIGMVGVYVEEGYPGL